MELSRSSTYMSFKADNIFLQFHVRPGALSPSYDRLKKGNRNGLPFPVRHNCKLKVITAERVQGHRSSRNAQVTGADEGPLSETAQHVHVSSATVGSSLESWEGLKVKIGHFLPQIVINLMLMSFFLRCLSHGVSLLDLTVIRNISYCASQTSSAIWYPVRLT